MNKKEKRNIEINFGFMAIASGLGVLLNVFSNAVYDLLTEVYELNLYLIVILFAFFILLVFKFLDTKLKDNEDKE